MACLLVTYDLTRENARPNITGAIKRYPSWARLSESSYAISTDEIPDDVYNKLKPLIDKDDYIYVTNLRKPYMGYGSAEVNNWLEQNLPG